MCHCWRCQVLVTSGMRSRCPVTGTQSVQSQSDPTKYRTPTRPGLQQSQQYTTHLQQLTFLTFFLSMSMITLSISIFIDKLLPWKWFIGRTKRIFLFCQKLYFSLSASICGVLYSTALHLCYSTELVVYSTIVQSTWHDHGFYHC